MSKQIAVVLHHTEYRLTEMGFFFSKQRD
uniref:Uncharacterized protein n=1 Tax=Anguilla anguilla TaxID=7936 RepID=A0A0E9T7T9_ANGAN